MMKQSTSFAQVATNLLNVLQGYSKTIRLLLVMFLTLTVSANVWGATYNFSNIPTSGWKTNGGSQTINGKSWNYSSSTYIGVTNSKIQVGSSKNPQTTNWTIQIPISSFGANIKVTKVAITAYTTATTATYDISVNGSSVKSGNLTTSSATYSSNTLNATTGSIVVTLKGSSNSKAMYLSNIAVTYETAAAHTVTWTINPAAGGSLSPTSGTSTTVTPNAAYTYANPAYTVTSGAATVSQSGNTFTATPTANSTIQINMVEKPKYTVTLVPGSGSVTNTELEEPSAGEGVTLPTPTLDGCDEWSFAGWKTTSAVTTETTTEPTLIPAGNYKPSNNITLYAVYKRTETSGDAFAGYEKVNEDLDDWSGKYLLSTGTYTATGSYSSNHLPRTTYTPSFEEKNEWEFTLTKVGNVGYSILFPDGSWYLGWKDGTDFVRSTEDPSENIKYLWTPSINGISNVSATTRKIADNGSADFRPYSSPSSGTVYLYKRVGGSSTTYYHSTPECTTEPTVCLIHENRYFYSLFF